MNKRNAFTESSCLWTEFSLLTILSGHRAQNLLLVQIGEVSKSTP